MLPPSEIKGTFLISHNLRNVVNFIRERKIINYLQNYLVFSRRNINLKIEKINKWE